MNIFGVNINVKHDLKQVEQLPGNALKAAGGALKHAIVPDRFSATPNLPAYSKLTPAQLADARARSTGLTVDQPSIRGKDGRAHEPINLVISGTQAEVAQALKKAGWHQADTLSVSAGFRSALTLATRVIPALGKVVHYNYQSAPVSDMYLAGRHFDMAFEKNSAHETGRDHLRVFDTGKLDVQGRPIWAVAATRDTGIAIDFKKGKGYHQIDHHIDHERDMVMADLLKTGQVNDWQVAQGQMSPADRARVAKAYPTDGSVYTLDLQRHPSLRDYLPRAGGISHWVDHHAPAFLRKPYDAFHAKLLKFFRSTN